MSSINERLQILEMIDSGVISAEEGARLLQSLEGKVDEDERDEARAPDNQSLENLISGQMVEVESTSPDISGDRSHIPEEFNSNMEKWRRWWMLPLWIGVGITIVGGLLMFWAFQASGLSFWFGCAWLPFLLGLGVIMLAWSTRTARWLHLRIHQKPGERPQKIALSFPLPIRLTSWLLRLFGHKLPKFGKGSFNDLILALGEFANTETPFYIEVDEGDEGERVQIYIG